MTKDRDDRRSATATALLGVALAEVATAVAAGAASGLGWARLADLFVVTNAIIGLSLALAGWPIAYHRPRNPVGWSLLVGGCFYASTATGVALLALAGEPTSSWRVLATLTNGGWTWALALFIPLALMLFPDGRLPGRRWRWLVALLVVNAVVFTATGVLDPLGGLTADVGVPGYPAWSGFWPILWLQQVAAVGLVIGYASVPVALILRYRRGSEQVRQQLLWPMFAVLVIVACFAVEGVLGLQTLLLGVLPLTLVPLSIAVAVLRYQLLDIRLAVSRSVLYLLLTGGVVAGYLGLVTLLDRTLRQQVSLNSSVLATLVIALAFNPVRVWLQRLVHRAFYGARRDPVRAIAAVGARLGDVDAAAAAGAGLTSVLDALCQVMRFPAAAIEVNGKQVARHGQLPAARHALTLRSGEKQLGELVIGLRSGEHRLDAADGRILALLAAPLTVAVQAGQLADELQVSREHVISGREEERRRIRRDLHDGLGPVLTGVVLNADTALHLLDSDPDRSAELLANLRDHTIGAIDDIRRLVYDLRPPALDGMGLIGALREYAAVLSRPGSEATLTVTFEAPSVLADVSAAVEVAAYRIATEALTNVVRHSNASAAILRLCIDDATLRLEVCDDGSDAADDWQPGVGLTSICERTSELGGTCEIRYGRTGGQVSVSLPLSKVGPIPRATSEMGANA